MHPSIALFQDQTLPVFLPVCDHYAGSEKFMRKAISIQSKLGPSFDITLDCEDGATVGNELAQAQLIASLLSSDENKWDRIGVRCHPLQDSFFKQDIEIILSNCTKKIAYFMLPKSQNCEQVETAIDAINMASQLYGHDTIPIHVLIETHEALANVMQIAAIKQVESLSFGIMDFVSSHNGAIPSSAMHSPMQFSHPLVARAKIEIAAACHRFGKVPSHNVCTDYKNIKTVAEDAKIAANNFAYTRMWSIHPDQIEPIIQSFTPNLSEINTAVQILLKAQLNNWGPTHTNDHLHDRASYRFYWTILKRAQQMRYPLPDNALSLL